ncbi:hypothetical protein [Roseimaritima ulvae]|uniref:Uncharacterized protein n=1 Tax=Roseimaritima ulvae TaxID=980254 RepID=A0A5B9QLJ3_9BACT|nr:hypothetical protein [Roseimaritima ulvae]QEG39814.1 hypothetical protein UC8_18130 [Roseimaritima ulvae]
MTKHHEQGSPVDRDSLELQMQRLVDGELDVDGRRWLLQQADSRPAMWRQIALRFIEEQSLQANRSVFVDAVPPTSAAVDPADHESPVQTPVRPARQVPRWAMLAGLVACLLFGVSIGRLLTPAATLVRAPEPPPAADMPSAKAAPAPPVESAPATDSPSPPGVRSDVSTRLVGLNKTGQSVVDLPLVPVKSLSSDVLMGHDHASLDELHQELARRGIELRYQTTVVDGMLPDGRQMYLPVHEVSFTNVGY